MVGTILGAIVLGVILGPLARLIIPGRQNISVGVTIAAGAAAALVGGIVADLLGLGNHRHTFDLLRMLVQVLSAIAAIAVVTRWSRRPRQSS